MAAFDEVKNDFDPQGMINPKEIVCPHHIDDRNLFRYKPEYMPISVEAGIEWKASRRPLRPGDKATHMAKLLVRPIQLSSNIAQNGIR